MGLSPSISNEAFEDAVYERIGKDDFGMESLRWWETAASLPSWSIWSCVESDESSH